MTKIKADDSRKTPQAQGERKKNDILAYYKDNKLK